MNYAYKTLRDELKIINKAIKEGSCDGHSESLKDRIKKVKDLNKEINLIDDSMRLIDKSKETRTDRQVGNYKIKI